MKFGILLVPRERLVPGKNRELISDPPSPILTAADFTPHTGGKNKKPQTYNV